LLLDAGMVKKLDAAPEPAAIDVGPRLARYREAARLTQRALAERCGVSHSTISLIERERVSPSISILKQILDGFPVSLSEFFAEPPSPGRERYVFRRAELTNISNDPQLVLFQVGANLKGRALQIMREIHGPGASTGPAWLRHEGEEGGVVVRGRLEITVDGTVHVLEPGDAYHFPSRLPHGFRNLEDGETEVISVCTPPSF